MELTEHLATQLKLARERIDEARVILDRITDVPIRSTGPCVYRELMADGASHDEAWTQAGRIANAGQELSRQIVNASEQAEIITNVLADAAGLSPRTGW
jgi:hypothetical protein